MTLKSRVEIQTVKLAPLASELKPLPGREDRHRGPSAEALEKPSLAALGNIEAKRIADECMTTLPAGRWSAKALTGNARPRTREEHTDFLMAAFEPGDTFDFRNPEDVTEFENLYRRPCRKGMQPRL